MLPKYLPINIHKQIAQIKDLSILNFYSLFHKAILQT